MNVKGDELHAIAACATYHSHNEGVNREEK